MQCSKDGCPNTDARYRCSVCKEVYYCSEKCQKEMWKLKHKRECKATNQKPKLPPRPRSTHCTGCNVKFSRDYPSDGTCPDCGYTACESCICHDRRGSCFCENSNFGKKYCDRTPQSYQRSSYTNKQYTGGHHPVDDDVLTVNPEKNPDLYEDADRLCDNCGQMKRFLKKGAYEAFLKEEAKKPGNHWLLW